MPRRPGPTHGTDRALPSRREVIEYLRNAKGKTGLKDIARAFRLEGGDRMALKAMLAEMSEDGTLKGNRRRLEEAGTLPPVTVLEVRGRDDDGELYAEPVDWGETGTKPRALLIARSRVARAMPALGTGDRILARVTRIGDGRAAPRGGEYAFEAEPIRQLPKERPRQLGIFRAVGAGDGDGRVLPIDRRELTEWRVPGDAVGEARDGELVRFELARGRGFAAPTARILERLGNPGDQRQTSLIALHAHGLPDAFPKAALQELDALAPPEPAGRVDLTGLALVTIDPVDARDHDDAVHAESDADPGNPGGFIVTVAIADVAHYVRPGSKLDREAELRANSIYFPDRVVPMLPELISNDLCSLREGETRPALVVRMVFDAHGQKRNHRFQRAMIRVALKLAYEEAQAAFEGKPGPRATPHLERTLQPLWKAYRALAEARDQREPLALDLPERKLRLDGEGRVARVETPQRLEAHRLIEEMMIQANVAAAETLEARREPCVYRVHDRPSKEKLQSLADFLDSLELRLPKGGGTKAGHFNAILARTRALPVAELVGEVVLRAQAQAEYAVENIGHFGLNLRRYAHFTSPIRRYADLLVHRTLIRGAKLGAGGLDDMQEMRLASIADAISKTERRTMAAERETVDRLIAAHLADRIGAEFDGRVAGVTRVGLFVRLKETGADGFIPVSSLGQEYFRHDEARRALVGERSGRGFRLGAEVRVRLIEAVPTAGALRFEMLSEGKAEHASLQKGWQGKARGKARLKGRRPPPPARGNRR